MSAQKTENPIFEVIPKANFVEAESQPDNQYYYFSYHITIVNKTDRPAKLVSRHWYITDGSGQLEEVKGPGVVGQQPRLMPHEAFTYESACPLQTPTGSMRGVYRLMGDDGQEFDVEIPEFFLICPTSLH